MISGIDKKAVQAQKGMTYSTTPKGIVVGSGKFMLAQGFEVINGVEKNPNGEGIKPLLGLTGSALKGKSKDELLALVQPPSPKANYVLTAAEAQTTTSLNEAVNKQLIQQFYEAYYSPTGLKDTNYRLGAIQSNISDLHQLFPNGVPGLVSSSSDAAWRANINYMYSVDEGLGVGPYVFKSYAFPPFISKSEEDFNAYKQDGTPTKIAEAAYKLDTSFDLDNLLYKGNQATIRAPGFKSINDNINTLQFMYNRSFGIESTYINEWDLSLYMQEGVVQYVEQPNAYKPNETIYLPQFVTTLTYGLVNDAPIAANAKKTNGTKTINVNDVTPFASFNMAVSTRKSVDNLMVSQTCCTMSYEIAHYPLSTYWFPSETGTNLDSYIYYTKEKVPVCDSLGNPSGEYMDTWKTRYSNMNVAAYIDQLFAYRQSGKIYAENAEALAGGMKKYTPAHIHGPNLRNATCSFEYVLQHADARDAVLSGWNSTDSDGKPVVTGYSKVNDYAGANAYSYLPFWKQFFFQEGDGMEELDQYWQELQGSTDPRKSFLEAAQEILGITCANNTEFSSFCTEKEQEYQEKYPNAFAANASPYTQQTSESTERGNIKVSLPLIGEVEIPKTKLLNMFLHRKEDEMKAYAKRDKQQKEFVVNTFANVADVGQKAVGGAGSGAPTPEEQAKNAAEGKDQVMTYDISNEENLGSTISYGEGVNNHSPFLYGGPHGAFYSPQTLEGYCQPDNRVMETVPTMDPSERYNYRAGSNIFANLKPAIGSKNFKLGNYADSKVCMAMSERNYAYNVVVPNVDPTIWMFYSGGWSTQHITTRSACWDWSLSFWWFWRKRKTWHFCIPTRFIFSEARWSGNWPWLRWFWKWENRYWSNYSAGHTSYVWRPMRLSEIQRDFSQEFTLIPQGYNTRMNSYWCGCWWCGEWDNGKRWDTYLYQRYKGKWTTVDGTWNYNLDLGQSWQWDQRGRWRKMDNHPHLRYIVAETDGQYPDTSYSYGKYVTAYDRANSTFEVIKRNMYTYANGWRGVSDHFTISLPITNNGNIGDVVNICCGPANVEKQAVKVVVWEWRYYWSWGHWWTWSWCHHWWTSCHSYWGSWWCRPRRVWYKYYYEGERDTYTMYFYPDKMKYSLPTKKYVATAHNDNSGVRDKSTSSIINRWNVNTHEDYLHGPRPLTSLIDWFPFSASFQDKFGRGWWPAPGTHLGFKNHIHNCLQTRGLIIGDIMENYQGHNHNVFIRGGEGYRWLYSTTGVGYQKYVHEFDVGWYLYVTNTSDNYRAWTIPVRSQYMIAANTGGGYDSVLTQAISELSSAPAVLQYYVNDEHHSGAQIDTNRRFQFFNVDDVFGVFIDTVTVQLAWLKQMLLFAKTYLNDYTIWKTYMAVTDNKIKTIIAEAYDSRDCGEHNKWQPDYYLTGNATEDINYYDALMVVKMAFGYQEALDKIQQFKEDKKTWTDEYTAAYKDYSTRNTVASLISRRISDLGRIKWRAELYRAAGTGWENLNNFSKFVSDTKALLDNVNGIREHMFQWWGVYTAPGAYNSYFYMHRGSISFNLVENPATIIWAYLNVLYQARKFYINKRLDKVQGSYWIMRSLERIMTFQAAKAQNEDRADLLDGFTAETETPQNKEIAFVMSRDDPTAESLKTEIDVSPSYTKAVWVPVDYVAHPDPTSTSEYANGKYRGKEIVYVPEVYKWAYKPKDGLYYVMSKDITENIKNYISAYTDLYSEVENEIDDITMETLTQADSLGKITEDELDTIAQKGTEDGKPVYYEWKGNKTIYNWFVGKKVLEIPDLILYSRYKDRTFGTGKVTSTISERGHFEADGIKIIYKDEKKDEIIAVEKDGKSLTGKKYEINDVGDLVEVVKEDDSLSGYINTILAGSIYKYDPSCQSTSDVSKHRYDNWQCEVSQLLYKNRMSKYYYTNLYGKAKDLMYPIYIEWNPSATGSAMTIADLSKAECHYIDDYQYTESATRIAQYEAKEKAGTDSTWEWPTVEDGKQQTHKVGILKAGITFGVAAGVNIDTIVSNIPILGNATSQEIACAVTNKKDYWRIEIPDASKSQNEGLGHNIPVALLEHKPVLVSNYRFQIFEKEMNGDIAPTIETTLVGLSSNAMSPIMDFNPEMCTAATLAGVGEMPSLKSLGMTGLTAAEAESHFG